MIPKDTTRFLPIVLCMLMAYSPSAAQNAADTSHGDELVHAYFEHEVRRIQSSWLEGIEGADDWEAARPKLQQELREMLGLDPMPPRTDLKATVTGTVEHELFTVEKLHFQSMPGLYVTANLYVPKNRSGPFPGVLYVCGHANRVVDGVSLGAKTAYQRHPAWYARHGYVALIIDTIQLAEIEGVHHGTHNLDRWWWWNRGYTPAGVEAWNGIRALDYLASRPEVDSERLIVTGRSGGGAYSWYVSALDDRVQVSVPTAGITDLRDHVLDGVVAGHCDCMYMINKERWDFPELASLFAPRPLLLANGDVDPIFPLDGVMRVYDRTRQVYAMYNRLDRFDHLIVNAGHDDIPSLQQGTYCWIHPRVHGESLDEVDPADTLFHPVDLKVFDELPEDQINTSIDEIFVKPAPEPELPRDRTSWRELRRSWIEALKDDTFGGWPTEAGDLNEEQAFASTWGKLRLEAVDFDSQEPYRLRIWMLSHADVERPERTILSVSDSSTWASWQSLLLALAGNREAAEGLVGPGAASGIWEKADPDTVGALAERLLRERAVLAVFAPRGVGPTAWTESDRGNAVRRSFMLLGQTYEGMQVWDVRRALAALRSRERSLPLEMEADGRMAGVALYAALFESDLKTLSLRGLPSTHRNGPIFLNVRKVFDVPQAVAAALESVEVLNLGMEEEEAWRWPASLSTSGFASGKLESGDRRPWLTPLAAE